MAKLPWSFVLLSASHVLGSPWSWTTTPGKAHGPPAYGEEGSSWGESGRPLHSAPAQYTTPAPAHSSHIPPAHTSHPDDSPHSYGPSSWAACEASTVTLLGEAASTVTEYLTTTLTGKPPKDYTKTEVHSAPGVTFTSKVFSTVTRYDTVRQNASTINQVTTVYKPTTKVEHSYITKVSTSTCTETITTSLPGKTVTEKAWKPASTITKWQTESSPPKVITVEETEVEYSTIYNTHTATELKVITVQGPTTTQYKTIPAGPPQTEVITKTLPVSTKYLTATVTAKHVSTVVVTSKLPAGPPETIVITIPVQTSYLTKSITKDYTTTITSIVAPTTVTETFVSKDVIIETCYKTLPAATITSTSYQAASTIYSYKTITSDYVSTVTSVIAPGTVVSYWTSTLPAQTSMSTVYEMITKPVYQTTTKTLAPSTVTSIKVKTYTTAIVSWTTKTLAPSTITSTEVIVHTAAVVSVITQTLAPSTSMSTKTEKYTIPVTEIVTHTLAPSTVTIEETETLTKAVTEHKTSTEEVTVTKFSKLPGATHLHTITDVDIHTSVLTNYKPTTVTFWHSCASQYFKNFTITRTYHAPPQTSISTYEVPQGPEKPPKTTTITAPAPHYLEVSIMTKSYTVTSTVTESAKCSTAWPEYPISAHPSHDTTKWGGNTPSSHVPAETWAEHSPDGYNPAKQTTSQKLPHGYGW